MSIEYVRSSEITLKVKTGLNKLDSSDYQNIKTWQIQQEYHKAKLNWCRRQIHGGNKYREGKEQSIIRVDDLQILLVSLPLKGVDGKVFFKSNKLPKDYFDYSRVICICSKGNCKDVQLTSDLVEEGNVSEFLGDFSKRPSFDFEQCFHSLFGNRVNVYHDGEFTISGVTLNYYRLPMYLPFPNAPLPDGTTGVDTEEEFKRDIVEQFIEETIKNISGDISYQQRYQIADKEIENNN